MRETEAEAQFDVTLRRVGRAEPDPALAARCLPGAESAGSQPMRVLVVDDEPNVRRLIRIHLERGGYQVREAADGEAALERIPDWRPHLVVLDVMMPGIGGIETLRRIKGEPETADLLVLLLTAHSGDDAIRRTWGLGVDFHMAKPFNPEALRDVVDRMTALIGSPDNPPPLGRGLK